MSRKNILLLINQLHSGGAEKVAAGLSRELIAGYHVTLAIFNDFEKIDFPFAGELVKIQLPYSNDTRKNNILKRAARLYSLTRQLRRLKKQRNISVSLSFLEVSNIANILSSQKDRTIVSVRSYLSNEFRDDKRLKALRIFIRLLYNKSDRIIAPAAMIKTDLTLNFHVREDKTTVIYNYIDSELIEKLKTEPIEPALLQIMQRFPVIANAGRMTNPKAQWLLPAVLKKLKERIPQAKLLILGDGPLKEKIVQEARNHVLNVVDFSRNKEASYEELSSADILFAGFRKNPYPYFAGCRAYIKSSVYEGFPNVLIEAMASGLPVVSSDCASGPREILAPDSDFNRRTSNPEYATWGILTGVYGENGLTQSTYAGQAAEALTTLLSDEQGRKEWSSRSTQRARDFQKETIIRQWITEIEG